MYIAWQSHSHRLGLRENHDKTQLTHKTAAGRRSLEASATFAAHVHNKDFRALGAILSMGAATTKELERVQGWTWGRQTPSPNAASTRALVAGVAAASKFVYGWTARAPANKVISKLETKLKCASHDHSVASTHLAKMVTGHSRDVCCAGAQAIAACTGPSRREARRFKTGAALVAPTRGVGRSCRI